MTTNIGLIISIAIAIDIALTLLIGVYFLDRIANNKHTNFFKKYIKRSDDIEIDIGVCVAQIVGYYNTSEKFLYDDCNNIEYLILGDEKQWLI